jgi:class 3 adenylate cyclase
MLVRRDYYGPVVNLAARAADLAVPYEILVSDDRDCRRGAGFRFEPAGRRLLKGFRRPWRSPRSHTPGRLTGSRKTGG